MGAQQLVGNAALQEWIASGNQQKLDELTDLTPSQREWISYLREIEQLNPDASVQDLSMAMSLKVWSAGQMWDKNGKSQYPGLILDYEGGDGYKSVVFPERDDEKGGPHERLKRWAKDSQGDNTNVNHAFSAVASQAGRGGVASEYASFMTTSGGDTMQNLGHMLVSLVDGDFGGMFDQFSGGEYAGNFRAEAIADEVADGDKSLSELLLGHFRDENKDD